VDSWIVWRKIVSNNNVEKLQIDVGRLGEWELENGMKIQVKVRQLASREPG
jgi:hypothetical protein